MEETSPINDHSNGDEGNNNHASSESLPVQNESTENVDTDIKSEENTTEVKSEETAAEVPMPSDDEIVEAMKEIINEHDTSEITLRKLKQLLEEKFGRDLTEKKEFIKGNIMTLLAAKTEENAEEKEEEKEEDNAEEKEDSDAKDEDVDATLHMSKADLEVQQLLMDNIKYGGGRVTRARASGKPTKPIKSKSKKRKSTDGENEDEEEAPKKKKKGTSRANRPKELSPALAEFMGETKMARPDVVKRLHEYFKANNLQNPKNKRQILFDEKLQQVFKKKTTDYFQLNTLLTKHLTDPGELV